MFADCTTDLSAAQNITVKPFNGIYLIKKKTGRLGYFSLSGSHAYNKSGACG